MPIYAPVFFLFLTLAARVVSAGCIPDQPSSTPDSRFVLNGATVYDTATRLTWMRCTHGTAYRNGHCTGQVEPLTLSQAHTAASAAGKGWRLPTIDELASLVEERCIHPAINSRIFPDVAAFSDDTAPYWTSTPIPDMEPLVFMIDFYNGDIDGHTEGFIQGVRLVRSGR